MPAFNFKEQFAPDVESGKKRGTIRAFRNDGKPHAKVGDTLMLYTGMRTKACRKLRDATCTKITPVHIAEWGGFLCLFLDGVLILDDHEFAKDDGFETSKQFYEFFEKTHGLPFYGSLFEWDPTSSHGVKENKCDSYIQSDGKLICDSCMIVVEPGSPIPICEKTRFKIVTSVNAQTEKEQR